MTTHAQLNPGIARTPSGARTTNAQVIAGRTLTGIAVLFLLFDGVAKLVQPQPVIEGHVRVGSPLFTHVLFPTYVAALVWSGLILREPLLRVILPSWRRA